MCWLSGGGLVMVSTFVDGDALMALAVGVEVYPKH